MHRIALPRFKTLAALVTLGVFTLATSAFAQEVKSLRGKPSRDQILEALTPNSAPANPSFRTRGLSVGNPDAAKSAPAPAQAAADAPSQARALDLEIKFEFNSDQLTGDGKDVLDQLGEALKSDALAGAKSIVLEGHADAKGSPAYNRVLSLKRAQSAKNFIASKHGIPEGKLKAVGKGSSEPIDPKNPEDAVNRRVRVIVNS
jgi:Outer membrane protein and related peptidoglycan-associated (lipo)proteins